MNAMEREYKLFGKNMEKGDEQQVVADLSHIREKERKPLEGEPEKSPDELRFISRLNDYIQQEFKELGIQESRNIEPNQIHLLPRDVFERHFGERIPAFHSTTGDSIYAVKDRLSKEILYDTLVHEAIHAVSLHKFHVDKEKRKVSEYRTGYQTRNPSRKKWHFSGFSEALTEKFARDIYNKHLDALIEEFGVSEKEPQLPMVYDRFMQIVDTIVKRVAERKGEAETSVWQRFKRGLITGEMLHLRDVEETYGGGSLRVLAALDALSGDVLPELIDKVDEYFTTDDIEKRKSIAHEILSGSDLRRYNSQSKSS